MQDAVHTTVLADRLHRSAAELAALAERVGGNGQAAARIDLDGWRGPASWACHLSLGVLDRELEAVTALIRGASNLVAAAAWEVETRG